MNIETARLSIRNLKTSDLDGFILYRSNPEVTKYQSFDTMTISRAKNFIKSQKDKTFGNLGEWVQYAIENRKTQTIIGDCAIKLSDYDGRIAEIGITISHLEQKKGYAKETLNALLNYLFRIEGFHRVVENVDVENTGSIQLLESVGFRKEGHFIQSFFSEEKWGSEYQYAMLRNEWNELQRIRI